MKLTAAQAAREPLTSGFTELDRRRLVERLVLEERVAQLEAHIVSGASLALPSPILMKCGHAGLAAELRELATQLSNAETSDEEIVGELRRIAERLESLV